jgi:putative chitinase
MNQKKNKKMEINRFKFYTCIRRNIFGKLSQAQVDSINAILDECENINDERWIAYIFGTVYHETAHKMLPIEEYGKGKNKPYGKKVKYNGESYEYPDKLYYGRGFPQLTWYENYELFGKILGIQLLEQPELALKPDISAKILVTGMTRGLFTGKKLADYFNSEKEDWINARRIINGLDCATIIANYSKKFLHCVIIGRECL